MKQICTFFVIFLLSILDSTIASSGEVMGCGGFVKSNKNNIDLSRIQISLYEKRNNIQRKVDSTDCAPNNGYFFLPLSPDDKGVFLLKAFPPRGWKVEPSEFEINIDGQNDECSQGKDINFEFIGFGITGSVISKGSDKGPENIKIELKKNDVVISAATTDSDGKFDFFGVTPGDYVVQVHEEFIKILALDVSSRNIHVGEDVGNVQPFEILGYRINGKVLDGEDVPLPGVSFDLFDSNSGGKPLMSTKSVGDGTIIFKGVPVGQYKVSLSKTSKIELFENEQEIQLGHDNVHLKDFKVKSFSVNGKVLTGKRPLADVKVTAEKHDGFKEELISDKNGVYILKGISKGPLIVKAILEGYHFEGLTLNKVIPGTILPTLSPSRFRLSGKVDRSGFSQEITVKFNNDNGDTIGKVSVTEKGQFSIYLPVGEYSVAVELSQNEDANVGFAPLELKATVVDQPIKDLDFHAIKADIEGNVKCLGPCGTKLEVTLNVDGHVNKPVTVPVTSSGYFKFSNVLPATYTISISEDGKCWEEPIKKISVSKDVKDIVFQQIGNYITLDSTRATLLNIQGLKTKFNQEVVIAKGNNVICIRGEDTDVSLSTKGCEEFEITPDTLNLKDPKTGLCPKGIHVSLKPIKYSVSGRIGAKDKIPDLKVLAKSDRRQLELELQTSPEGGYSFNMMAFPGEEVILKPQSGDHLFEPESLHVFVDHDCHLEVAIFSATKGHFVKGQITPPVEGVKIMISNQDKSKQKESSTDNKGQYNVGPLPHDKYDVEASKDGYVFEKTTNGFKSKKLASIMVKVQDLDKNPLSDVVVSVSGGNYRSNTKSLKDGTAEFLSLAPGEYFIKPQFKEYEFNPKHKLQQLKEGENAEITLSAKRIAFSIFGKIVSLNGQPEPSITLRASTTKCSESTTEEAITESDGTFRFRGLTPKCDYSIKLLHGESIEKLIPSEVTVSMTESDHTLAKPLVAMRAFETMDAHLKVTEHPKPTQASQLKISMTSMNDNSFTFNTKAVTGQLVPLPRIPKDNKKYNIHVETIPDKFAPQKKVSHTLVADDYFKSVRLVLNKTANAQKSTRKASSMVFILPIIIGALVTAWFLFKDQQMPQFLKKWLDPTFSSHSSQVNRDANSDNAGSDGFDVSSTPSGGKRKNKKR